MHVHIYLTTSSPCSFPSCVAMCRTPPQCSLWCFSCSSFHLSLAVHAKPAANQWSASQVVQCSAVEWAELCVCVNELHGRVNSSECGWYVCFCVCVCLWRLVSLLVYLHCLLGCLYVFMALLSEHLKAWGCYTWMKWWTYCQLVLHVACCLLLLFLGWREVNIEIVVTLITCTSFCTSSACIAAGRSDRLLDWTTVHHKLPWNVVLLLGSGFALAKGAQVSLEWDQCWHAVLSTHAMVKCSTVIWSSLWNLCLVNSQMFRTTTIISGEMTMATVGHIN